MYDSFTPRFDVSNLDKWGCLIKSWATHLDYINVGFDKQPPRTNWVNQSWPAEAGRTPGPATVPDTDAHHAPKPWCLPPMTSIDVPGAGGTKVTISAVALTADEFVNKVGAAGVIVKSMPDQYANVVIVQGNVQTMILRLPPKDTLQSSEDDLITGNPYPYRPFYATLFGGAEPNMPTDQAGIMQLHANRIGEYTLNTCN